MENNFFGITSNEPSLNPMDNAIANQDHQFSEIQNDHLEEPSRDHITVPLFKMPNNFAIGDSLTSKWSHWPSST